MAFEQVGVEAVVEGVSSFKRDSDTVNKSLASMSQAVTTAGMTWTEFLKGRMGPAMKEYGSHSAAIKHLSEQYHAYKASLSGAASATGSMTSATRSLTSPLQSLGTFLSNIARQSLSGVAGGIRSIASGIASISVGILETAGRALGNILQIATGIVVSQVLVRIADAIGQIARRAFEAAAEFQTLQIQMTGLIALQISDEFNNVTESLQQTVHLTAEETEKLKELALASSDLHSKIELQERKIESLTETYGENSAEVNIARNQLTRLIDKLQETDGAIAALNAKEGQLITITRQVTEGNITMAEAMAKAEGPARDLLNWISDFGVKTPFTIRQLSELVRDFLSIGLAVPETQRLTTALAGLGAGLGLTQAQLDRVVANIVQTSRSMKITERDIREFGNAGIPVNRVLDKMAEQLGLTRQGALEFAKSGEEGVKAFVEGIQQVAEKDFPDALENLSKTWAVAASNIQDVIESIFGKEVIGPTLARLGELVAGVIDKVVAARAEFTKAGEQIAAEFDKIMPHVKPLLDSIGALTTSILVLAGVDTSNMTVSSTIDGIGSSITGAIDGLKSFVDFLNNNVIPVIQEFKDFVQSDDPFGTLATSAQNFVLSLSTQFPVVGQILAAIQTFGVVMSDIGAAIMETLAPSLEELGAAWAELLPHLQPALDALGKAATFILPALGAVLVVLLGVVVGVFNGIAGALTFGASAFNDFRNVFNEGLDHLSAMIIGMFELWQKIFAGDIPGALDQAMENIGNFVAFVGDSFKVMIGLVKVPLAIISGLVLGFVTGVFNFFKNLSNQLIGNSIIPDLMTGMLGIIKSGLGTITNAFADFVENVISSLRSMVDRFIAVGQELAAGILLGVLMKASFIADAAAKVVTDAIDAARKAVGISSPSKLAASMIGGPFAAGIAEGILSGAGAIRAATVGALAGQRMALPVGVSGVGAGGASGVTNNYDFSINANYAREQRPNTIADDVMSSLILVR